MLLICTTIKKRSLSSEIFSEVSVCRVPVDYCGTVSLYWFVPHALRKEYTGLQRNRSFPSEIFTISGRMAVLVWSVMLVSGKLRKPTFLEALVLGSDI